MQVAASLRELSTLLLPQSVSRLLPAAGEVVVVLHDILNLAPFAALAATEADRPLGIRYALHYSPSLSVLAEAEGRRPIDPQAPDSWKDALIVGDPAMPSPPGCQSAGIGLQQLEKAGASSSTLARMLDARYLTGTNATKATVRARLPEASFVHLATHGYAYQSSARARESWVALAPSAEDNGLLSVAEITDGPMLRADLVVLAACATGLGDFNEMEGTVGFQRAFLAKGARTVLVSQWMVREDLAIRLLDTFYGEWLTAPDRPSKAEALRRAQEKIWEVSPDPRYWAAFQLVGAS
jgi:CHAT domain-containing protein